MGFASTTSSIDSCRSTGGDDVGMTGGDRCLAQASFEGCAGHLLDEPPRIAGISWRQGPPRRAL